MTLFKINRVLGTHLPNVLLKPQLSPAHKGAAPECRMNTCITPTLSKSGKETCPRSFHVAVKNKDQGLCFPSS